MAGGETFGPVNSVGVLLEATRGASGAPTAPLVLADAGVENVNTQVDALIEAGILRRLLAFTELKFSNSMIEAWWPVHHVQHMLGHASLQRTSTYLNATLRGLHTSMQQFDQSRPACKPLAKKPARGLRRDRPAF